MQLYVTYLRNGVRGVRGDVSTTDMARMKGYLNKLKSHKFVLHLAAYVDIGEDVSVLSAVLQSDSLPITEVRSKVEISTMSLKNQLVKPAKHLASVLDTCVEGSNWQYKDTSLTVAPNSCQDDTISRVQLTTSILECV